MLKKPALKFVKKFHHLNLSDIISNDASVLNAVLCALMYIRLLCNQLGARCYKGCATYNTSYKYSLLLS